jgi:propanediol dehydratase small subunit
VVITIDNNIKSKTGKKLSDITIENLLNGYISLEDIKISADTLLRQGRIAEEHGRPQIKKNFARAAELTVVPDDVILKIYETLRPNRSTKSELLAIAELLEEDYKASECAKLVLDTAKVYEKRGILKTER